MKQLSKRLTYANVMSSIAVFLVLGGGAAFAANQLGKNSVGPKQLKKNAVTAAKIKNNAVTAAKIQNGAISGAKVDLGSLGTVPKAAHADTAVSATTAASAANAANAANAAKVNGQSVNKVFTLLTQGQSGVPVASLAGFSITASCGGDDVDVTMTGPSTSGSVIEAQGNGLEKSYFVYAAEESGTAATARLDGKDGEDNSFGQVSFSAALRNGTVISGELGYDFDSFGGENPNRCVVFGQVTSS